MEYILPIVSALKGMMVYIGYDEASVSWHEWDISEVVWRNVNKIRCDPFYASKMVRVPA